MTTPLIPSDTTADDFRLAMAAALDIAPAEVSDEKAFSEAIAGRDPEKLLATLVDLLSMPKDDEAAQ